MVGAIVPWNYPFEVSINKLGQAPRHRQHGDPEGRAQHAVERHAHRSPGGRADRHPARRAPGGHDVRQRRRRRPGDRPPGRPHLVHRLDRRRPPHHGEGCADAQAALPRARRQVGRHRPRRRRLRGQAVDGLDGLLPRRPGLRHAHPHAAAPVASTTRASPSWRRASATCPTATPPTRATSRDRRSAPSSATASSATSKGARTKGPGSSSAAVVRPTSTRGTSSSPPSSPTSTTR